jgi:hypothetical protein
VQSLAACCAPPRALTRWCALLLAPAPSPQALLAAALLAALPAVARADVFTINPIQPSSAAYVYDAYFGLTWGAVPRPLTPTNFTVTFPDGVVFSAADRIEIHLPGFGGGYNSFGAKTPDTTALAGGHLPYQNGITPYTRAGTPASIAATSKCIAGPSLRIPCLILPARDCAPPELCTDSVCAFETAPSTTRAPAAEWDAKREVLKVLVNALAAKGVGLACDTNDFEGVTINGAYLRQFYQSGALASGKGPLPPRGGIDSLWSKKAWMRRFPAAACSGAVANRAGLGSEVCALSRLGAEFAVNPDWSVHARFETTNDWVPSQEQIGAVGTALRPKFAYLSAGGSSTGKGRTTCITVTMVPSVTLSSAKASATQSVATDRMTSITLSGLNGATDIDKTDMPIFAGADCRYFVLARVFECVRADVTERDV